jgi:hypothetical protein
MEFELSLYMKSAKMWHRYLGENHLSPETFLKEETRNDKIDLGLDGG